MTCCTKYACYGWHSRQHARCTCWVLSLVHVIIEAVGADACMQVAALYVADACVSISSAPYSFAAPVTYTVSVTQRSHKFPPLPYHCMAQQRVVQCLRRIACAQHSRQCMSWSLAQVTIEAHNLTISTLPLLSVRQRCLWLVVTSLLDFDVHSISMHLACTL